MRFSASIFVALVAIGAQSNCAANSVRYNIVELDVLPGGLDSLAFGLNDVGQVVGTSRRDRSTHIGQSRPVVWDYTGQPTELWSDQNVGGTLNDINNRGEIVGRYGSGSGIPLPTAGVPFGRAFYWSEATGRIDIGFEPVGNSQAVAINELGQVVGTSERLEYVEIEPGNFQYQYIPHPFIWDKENGIRDLGTLGGYGGFATAINNLEQVVGYADLASGYNRAFVWDDMNGIRELETPPGADSRAAAINDLGHVVGGGPGTGSVMWKLIEGTVMPFPGGRAINNLGQTVGGAFIVDGSNGVLPLSDLVQSGVGWTIENSFAINDRSEIVGYGLRDGKVLGVLMTPVPEPRFFQFALVAIALILVQFRILSNCCFGNR